ncbi:MAG: NfeD family protein [Nitrospinae bacterium]|nr:NfeD family protein [Nitrospinota bacterium]
MPWWVWMVVGFLLVLLELLTPLGFYLLFLGMGALVVGILAGLDVATSPWVQWLLFSCLSVVAMLLVRRPLLTRFQSSPPHRASDSLIGETALAFEDIAVDAIGRVELRGTTWNARNIGTHPVTRGQRCEVEHMEGLTLWVRGA